MKNGFDKGKPPFLKIAYSNGRRSRGATPNVTTDESAQTLQQSTVALVEFARAFKARNERRSTISQKKLKILEETNVSLRRELIAAEKRALIANHLAYHDPLTGLPNRRLLLDRLNQAIVQASRQKKSVALVFFDVDGFKKINDKLGHTSGDKLLQGVAQRLCGCLRAMDTACRYGGDEFIVMLPEVDGEQSATIVEHKIRAQLATPYLIDGSAITVAVSSGTAVYPADANDYRELIKLADTAMYSAKANGAAPTNETTQDK